MKVAAMSPAGLLQPLPIPNAVFEAISMDFVTGLPFSKGKTALLVVVDRLSKYGHFIGLPTNFSSLSVATIFVQEIVRLHGVPSQIVCDRDPRFLSDFWKELHRLQGTTLNMSTAYHPQSDGQTEALNKCVEMYLRCFVADHPSSWLKFLPWAEFWYNTSYQTAARMTPFEVLYGRAPPTISRYVKDSSGNALVEEQLLKRDQVLTLLKSNLHKAQHRMKMFADKSRREVSFMVNDWVYVKLQPFRQNSVRLQRHSKLGRRYFGPYTVLARVGKVAYKLELPESARIHPVFHVSLLKKCIGKPDQQVMPLHMVDSTPLMVLQPHAILAKRMIQGPNCSIEQWQVQWDRLPVSEATWEDKSELIKSYPELNLEDKVSFDGDGIVVIQEAALPRPKSAGETWAARRGSRKRIQPKLLEDYILGDT